jgi:hypothetical protein
MRGRPLSRVVYMYCTNTIKLLVRDFPLSRSIYINFFKLHIIITGNALSFAPGLGIMALVQLDPSLLETLRDRVVVLTGGAIGIGRSAVEQFHGKK